MITKNFKQMLTMILLSCGNGSGTSLNIPATTIKNEARYLTPGFNEFPGCTGVTMATVRISTNRIYSGIYLGSGTTPPTENDTFVEQPITSGLTATSPTRTYGMDANGNPYLQYTIMLTNTTSNDIIVSEVGYTQPLIGSSSVGGSGTSEVYLLDHTVFDTPVTVPANDSAVIKYTLKTILPS